MSIQLRPYDSADFETLYAIDRACYPRGIAYSRSTLRWFLGQAGSECLVAQEEPWAGNRIAGFIIVRGEGANGHIITLDVAQSHRRTGVGSSLLHSCERRLAARGVRTVFLETAVTNEPGVAFWQRHGYRSFGLLPRYYVGRLDAYAMCKILAAGSASQDPHAAPPSPRRGT